MIAWLAAEPLWHGALLGAPRPGWCGHDDPRAAVLVAAYGFLLAQPASAPGWAVAQ